MYALLIGTVLTTFFSSMQNSLTRIMDPNEYDALLNSLVASFTNVNAACIIPGIVLLALLVWWLRRDLSILDVISLGREQAISLGVDYETTLRRLMVGVALCIAVATALVGPLSFLGLITANVANTDAKKQLVSNVIEAFNSTDVSSDMHTQTFKLKLQKIKSGKNTLHIFFPDNYEEVGSKLMKNATNQ